MTTAKQKAAQARFRAAAKQAKREGYSGKDYSKRVGDILRGSGSKGSNPKGGGNTTKPKGGGKTTKKITHTKMMDHLALGAGAVRQFLGYMEQGNPKWLTNGVIENYTGFHPEAKNFKLERMTRGYGAPTGRVVEKNLFRFIGIKPPRTSVKNFGDLLDHITYHGAAVFHVLENKGNKRRAFEEFCRTEFGVDLQEKGFKGFDLTTMFLEKELPYIAQKKIRGFLRDMGMRMNFG